MNHEVPDSVVDSIQWAVGPLYLAYAAISIAREGGGIVAQNLGNNVMNQVINTVLDKDVFVGLIGICHLALSFYFRRERFRNEVRLKKLDLGIKCDRSCP